MKRVHIVGMSPRTGTTLMMELMASCFKFDAYADHEMSILHVPQTPVSTFCSKHPRELPTLPFINDPNVWVICMIRDPRDVIVSKHRKAPDHFWTDLKNYRTYLTAYEKLRSKNPRLFSVVYEDLVQDPDKIQFTLERQIPFLQRTSSFSDFHKVAKPTEAAVAALGGVRKISQNSIGKWRNHMPRVKAQMELYGDISDHLIEFGYEADKNWLSELADVHADNGTHRRDVRTNYFRDTLQFCERSVKFARYHLGIPRRKSVILNPLSDTPSLRSAPAMTRSPLTMAK